MHITTVTQEGMVSSQPGCSVSTTWPARPDGSGFRISVSRHYHHLPNQFGGLGVRKPLDGDGMIFETYDAARNWLISHGYVRRYFTSPELRRHRLFLKMDPRKS